LIENPDRGIRSWQDWVCEQAALENAGHQGGRAFRRFLPFAPDISPFIEERLASFRSSHRLGLLAFDALGRRFAMKPSAIHDIAWKRTAVRPASGSEVQGLLLDVFREATVSPASGAAVPASTSRKHGPEPTPFENTTRYMVGMAVVKEISRTGDKSRKGVVAARYAITAKWKKLSYETVKEYHIDTVDWLKGRAS
jgi:hypothetical protein